MYSLEDKIRLRALAKLMNAKVPIPMKTPRHSDLMAPWIPT